MSLVMAFLLAARCAPPPRVEPPASLGPDVGTGDRGDPISIDLSPVTSAHHQPLGKLLNAEHIVLCSTIFAACGLRFSQPALLQLAPPSCRVRNVCCYFRGGTGLARLSPGRIAATISDQQIYLDWRFVGDMALHHSHSWKSGYGAGDVLRVRNFS